jgi:hypothetical protein
MVTDDWLKPLVGPSRDICIPQPITADGIPAWNVSFRLGGIGPLPTELRPFVKGLRIAIAHAYLDFTTDGKNITGVTFEHRGRGRGQPPIWQATFNLNELRGFLYELTDEVEAACKRRGRTRNSAAL